MNLLFLTLGTSEIQINSNPGKGFIISNSILRKDGLPDINLKTNRGYNNYLLKSPREDGENMFRHYEQFKSVIRIPLILPLIKMLEEEAVKLHEIWFIYTNQKDAEDRFKSNDTLFYKDIIKSKIKSYLPNIKFQGYQIEERVRDIDFQYKQFGQKMLEISINYTEIGKIYLLPQGGIDQINQALTLQLIQAFKDKVILYQNAEGSKPEKLSFTQLFLNDLTKQKVIKHIRDLDFDKAVDLIFDDEQLRSLAKYAGMRLNLMHDHIEDNRISDDYKLRWQNLSPLEQIDVKLKDLTYSFKISFKLKNYNESLTKLFSLTEVLFMFPISKYGEELVSNFYNRSLEAPGSVNEPWERFIEENLGKGYLRALKKKGKRLNNPNFLVLSKLLRLLIEDKKIELGVTTGEIKKITTIVNKLRDIRNEVVHNLGAANEDDIESVLSEHKTNEETFLDILDRITGISGLGIYGEIQKRILAHYGEIN